MVAEERFDIIMGKVVGIFQELELIVSEIKADFTTESAQDPRLSLKVVNNSLELASSCVKRFQSYRQRNESTWSLEKDINYIRQKLRSFYRQFDNPFLGSERWYQRIVQLLDQLSEESRELGRILEIQEDNENMC